MNSKQYPADLTYRETAFVGACLCSAVQFAGNGLREIVYCHCEQCRRFHGTVASYTATMTVRLHFTRQQTLRWFRSSESAERGFCAACGSALFWRPLGETYICIAAGAIAEDVGLRAARHVYVAEKPAYYTIDDAFSQFSASMTLKFPPNL